MISKEITSEVFGQINKMMSYGAPELKLFYRKYLTSGLLIAVSGFICLALLSFGYISRVKEESEIKIEIKEKIFTSEDLKMPQLPIDKVSYEIPKNIALKDLSALTPEAVAKKLVKEDVKIKSNRELENIKLWVSSDGTDEESKVTSGFTGKVEERKIEHEIQKIEEKTKDVFKEFEVEKAPVPVNLNSVKSSMNYPENARKTGTEGKVVARVLVGINGSVIKVDKITGPDIFRDEVSDKVMNLKFSPALLSNQSVKCWVNVPFNFKLSTKDKKETENETDNK